MLKQHVKDALEQDRLAEEEMTRAFKYSDSTKAGDERIASLLYSIALSLRAQTLLQLAAMGHEPGDK